MPRPRGCPKLQSTAYRADNLEEQLGHATEEFLSDPRHVRHDRRDHRLWLSRIFRRFSEDFGRDDTAIAAFVARHGPAHLRMALGNGSVAIDYLEYDWTLNSDR